MWEITSGRKLYMLVVPRTTAVVLCTHWVLSLVPPMQGRTPLTAACGRGHVAIVKLLLKAGAEVDMEDGDVRG